MSASGTLDTREAKNTLFTVLGNHRRRYVLYACNQANGETTLSDVAEQVAAWEYGKPVEEITSTERKRIYTSIQQHHLSKLEDAGLLDIENDHISTTEKAQNLDVYLEVVSEENIPWSTFYLGLSAVGGGFWLLSYLGWVPEPVTWPVVFALFVGLLATSASAHFLKSRRMRFDATNSPPEVEE